MKKDFINFFTKEIFFKKPFFLLVKTLKQFSVEKNFLLFSTNTKYTYIINLFLMTNLIIFYSKSVTKALETTHTPATFTRPKAKYLFYKFYKV